MKVIDEFENDYYFDNDKDKNSSILVGTWETISDYLLMIRPSRLVQVEKFCSESTSKSTI